MNRSGWMVGVIVAMGCTPLPEAPTLRADAAIDTGDNGMMDAGTADRGTVDDRIDGGMPMDTDVFGDEFPMIDGGDADVIDVPTDTDVGRSDVIDVPTDADAGSVAADVPRLVGGFVSSAIVGPPGRLSGGFTWQGVVSGMRLEGWLR